MVHIGRIIQEVQESKGMHITELGRRIGKTSQSIYDIFRRQSVSTDLLISIGTALEHDFFQYFQKPIPSNQVNDENVKYGSFIEQEKPYLSITINNIPQNKIKRIFAEINEIIK